MKKLAIVFQPRLVEHDFGLGVECYPRIASLVCQVADEVCRGRLLTVVSGGRNLEVSPVAASAIVASLAGREGQPPQDPFGPTPHRASGGGPRR